MTDDFLYDVFLCHSSKDKAVVRALADRLQRESLQVWFDEWRLRPGENIPVAIEEGLERSRILLLFMSANAFGSDWAQLESQTFRFRDPLNNERRFIPLRLDDAPIKGSLAQFLYINWRTADREHEYAKLLEASYLPPKLTEVGEALGPRRVGGKVIQLPLDDKDRISHVYAYAFSLDGKYALTGGADACLRLWDL